MENKLITFFIIFFIISCNTIDDKEKKNKQTQDDVTTNKVIRTTEERLDSFYLNNILFQRKEIRNIPLATIRSICTSQGNMQSPKYKQDTIYDETHFLFDMFDIYAISKTELELSIDFVKLFAKRLGWSDYNLRSYDLKMSDSMEVEILNYGICKFYVLKKMEIANAEQSKFLILLNSNKAEISLWDFDNFILKGSEFFVDFKMKNKHSIFQVNYCEGLGKFYFIMKE